MVDTAKKKKVAELKRALKEADELILATDEDREGEAIAWHLLQVLAPKVPVRRMVFHEITGAAIPRGPRADPRDRFGPGRFAGNPTDSRSALRFRRIACALAEGRPGPGCRSRAVGGHPTGRRAGAGTHRLPGRHPTGTSRRSCRKPEPTRGRSIPAWWRSMANGSRTAATSEATANRSSASPRDPSRRRGREGLCRSAPILGVPGPLRR